MVDSMKAFLLLIVAGAVVVGIANSHGSPAVTPRAVTPTAQPGSAAVYQRIAVETDCGTLQQQFDVADAAGTADRARGASALAVISATYMTAADDRMRAIGCY